MKKAKRITIPGIGAIEVYGEGHGVTLTMVSHRLVNLTVKGGPAPAVFMTNAEARRLAKALWHFANGPKR